MGRLDGAQGWLIRGGTAGALGALAGLIVSMPSYFLFHFEKEFWVKSLSNLVLGHPVRTLPEWLFAYLLYFLWAGWIGVLFARFGLPTPGEGAYYLRAVGFGFVGWLVTYTLGTFYRVPMLSVKAWQTAVSNIATLLVWGLVLGWLMKRWDATYERTQTGSKHESRSLSRVTLGKPPRRRRVWLKFSKREPGR